MPCQKPLWEEALLLPCNIFCLVVCFYLCSVYEKFNKNICLKKTKNNRDILRPDACHRLHKMMDFKMTAGGGVNEHTTIEKAVNQESVVGSNSFSSFVAHLFIKSSVSLLNTGSCFQQKLVQ